MSGLENTTNHHSSVRSPISDRRARSVPSDSVLWYLVAGALLMLAIVTSLSKVFHMTAAVR
jgi:hypothetical protein